MIEINMKDIDKDEHIRQHLELHNDILNGVSKPLFKIYNNECGTGKTLISNEAIAEAAVNEGKRIVFVRPKKEDTIDSAKSINRHAKEISSKNSRFLGTRKIAIAITSDNYKGKEKHSMKETILKSPVVVITHSRYKRISQGFEGNLFQNGRDTLIIDEKIEMVNPIEISLNHLKRFEGRLIPELREGFAETTSELLITLEKHSNQMKMFRPENKGKIINKLESLKRIISTDEMKKEHLKYLSADWIKENVDSKKLNYHTDFLTHLIYLFHGPTIITKSSTATIKAVTYDPTVHFWMLDNNIILDANADFDYTYKFGNTFHVKKLPLITDHSKWVIFLSTLQAYKSAKLKYKNFYDTFNLFTLDHLEDLNRILVIGSKDEITGNKFTDHNSNHIRLDYFGNMSGVNVHRNLRSAVILHNYQLPLYVYVLQYLFYSGVKDIDDRLLKTAPDKKSSYGHRVLRFDFKELEDLKISINVTHLYQAIKRINRDNSKPAKVYLTLHDEKVFDVLKKQMMNIKVRKWNHDAITYKPTFKKKVFNVEKLEQIIENCPPGRIEKKDLKRMLFPDKDPTKQSTRTLFSKIINDDRIEIYCKNNNIDIEVRYLYKHENNIA